jgi:hypothetical protein
MPIAIRSSFVLALLSACGGAPLVAPVPPVTSAQPAASSPPHEAAPSASSAAAYSGHGAETVPAALLEKYRPRALAPELARRIESLMDVRAPGIGMLSPDGKAMFFSWTITGIGQIWRVDGPRHFPQQMTGG